MRRHQLFAVTALAALVPAGAAMATAPPDTGAGTGTPSDPPSTEPTASMPAASMPADTGAGSVAPAASVPAGSDAAAPAAGEVAVFDEEGTQVASIAVSGMEPGWTDYGPDDAPDDASEYVRVTVTVTSLVTEDTFAVAIDDFVLQDAHGFLDTADNVPTAAQTESDEEIVEEADLANGESVELALTFEVDPAVGAQSVFYAPDDDRLVDVAEVA